MSVLNPTTSDLKPFEKQMPFVMLSVLNRCRVSLCVSLRADHLLVSGQLGFQCRSIQAPFVALRCVHVVLA